mmetsp:Transcript_38650/g.118799  ORF Transcript_38650/g.118799 Transcript_38650/m.118799 type:complete len:657 (-) Transcript_38650:266-2236(-)
MRPRRATGCHTLPAPSDSRDCTYGSCHRRSAQPGLFCYARCALANRLVYLGTPHGAATLSSAAAMSDRWARRRREEGLRPCSSGRCCRTLAARAPSHRASAPRPGAAPLCGRALGRHILADRRRGPRALGRCRGAAPLRRLGGGAALLVVGGGAALCARRALRLLALLLLLARFEAGGGALLGLLAVALLHGGGLLLAALPALLLALLAAALVLAPALAAAALATATAALAAAAARLLGAARVDPHRRGQCALLGGGRREPLGRRARPLDAGDREHTAAALADVVEQLEAVRQHVEVAVRRARRRGSVQHLRQPQRRRHGAVRPLAALAAHREDLARDVGDGVHLVRVVRGAVGRALDQVAHRAEQVELGSAGEERREEEVEAALRGGEARVLLVLLLKVRVVREQVDQPRQLCLGHHVRLLELLCAVAQPPAHRRQVVLCEARVGLVCVERRQREERAEARRQPALAEDEVRRGRARGCHRLARVEGAHQLAVHLQRVLGAHVRVLVLHAIAQPVPPLRPHHRRDRQRTRPREGEQRTAGLQPQRRLLLRRRAARRAEGAARLEDPHEQLEDGARASRPLAGHDERPLLRVALELRLARRRVGAEELVGEQLDAAPLRLALCGEGGAALVLVGGGGGGDELEEGRRGAEERGRGG